GDTGVVDETEAITHVAVRVDGDRTQSAITGAARAEAVKVAVVGAAVGSAVIRDCERSDALGGVPTNERGIIAPQDAGTTRGDRVEVLRVAPAAHQNRGTGQHFNRAIHEQLVGPGKSEIQRRQDQRRKSSSIACRIEQSKIVAGREGRWSDV